MRLYIYAAIAVLLAGSHVTAYTIGKRAIVAKLASDRIEVLQDGKRIDENVLSAGDDQLLCLLLDNCN